MSSSSTAAVDATYVDVAVPVPLRRTFTYRVPEALRAGLGAGSRVAVPFGARKLAGFVLGAIAQAPAGRAAQGRGRSARCTTAVHARAAALS